ncbi:hypothetical protein LIER_37799 [Lithospermum erythrorhizon]|uniref:Uncharacterized protein n=1 Tax=Lithospermum erythrorhizon TaxID=34254 RepID=A0AAV3PQR6_LITER
MKDLGDAKKILGMNIIRDTKKSTLVLNHSAYLEKDQSPKTESEINDIKKVPYSNPIESVMYLMVSTRPDITYEGIVKLEKIPLEFNPPDMDTKCLHVEKFMSCQKILTLT